MKTTAAIRLTKTPEVEKALKAARKLYPAMADPELLKLGLSQLITRSDEVDEELAEVNAAMTLAFGEENLNNPAEDAWVAQIIEGLDKRASE